MASPADQQATRNAAITALAAQQTAALWPNVDWTSSSAAGAVKTLYGAITAKYGRATAVVAATFYDQLRAGRELPTKFTAAPAEPVPQHIIDQIVQSAFLGSEPRTKKPLAATAEPQVTTSELPVEERVPQRLDGTLQRLVLQPGRDTIAANVTEDPAQPRYVRVPRGAKTCAFCVLLASRELNDKFTGYKSAQSAKFVVGRGKVSAARGSRPLGEKYHDYCDCEPVAVFPGQTAADVSPNFHDYRDMYFKGAADAGTHRDTKKILASMRQLHGLK